MARDEAEDFCIWLSTAFEGWIQWWIAKTSALEGELSTTGPVESRIGGDEVLAGGFGGFGRGDRRSDQDAVAEGDAGMGG